MKQIAIAAAALAAASMFAAAPAAAQAPECELSRPVMFAGLDWDSNAFHNGVARYIVEQGYGCRTDEIPGSTLPLLAGMSRGDIDVTMEIWLDNVTEPWNEGVEAGKLESLGTNFPDAVQGWWVPRYLVEGDGATAPELKSVKDLPKYTELFADPEEPGKGRFYNCILGWSCEVVNTKKLEAYGLLDDYTNFRPGTGAALAAAIASAVKREKPIVAYYWGPTWVLGKYDLVMLDEPEYDKETWLEMQKQDHPEQAVAYPLVEVVVGVNKEFAGKAPKLVEFLTNYETTNAMISEALAYMQDNKGASARDAAMNFLQTKQDVWTKWVPADVAERVKSSLKSS